MSEYPFQSGDVTVLGPQVIVSADGEVINWQGENYYRASNKIPCAPGQGNIEDRRVKLEPYPWSRWSEESPDQIYRALRIEDHEGSADV